MTVGHPEIVMELDMGASCSTVSETVYWDKLSEFPLYNNNITLCSYPEELVPIVVCTKVPVRHGDNQEFMLELVVVKGNRLSLLGRDGLSKIGKVSSPLKVLKSPRFLSLNQVNFHKSLTSC